MQDREPMNASGPESADIGSIHEKAALAVIGCTCLYQYLRIRLGLSGFLPSIFYYLLVLGLCTLNWNYFKKYFMQPFSKDRRLPVFIGYWADILLIYPLLTVASIQLIGSVLIFTGLFPHDVQNISQLKSTFGETLLRGIFLPLLALSEELFNLNTAALAYKHLSSAGRYRMLISALAGSLVFGLLHYFDWGLASGIFIGLSFIPVIYVTLHTGNIWIGILAHFVNDFITSLRIYSDIAAHYTVLILVAVPVAWAVIYSIGLLKRDS